MSKIYLLFEDFMKIRYKIDFTTIDILLKQRSKFHGSTKSNLY